MLSWHLQIVFVLMMRPVQGLADVCTDGGCLQEPLQAAQGPSLLQQQKSVGSFDEESTVSVKYGKSSDNSCSPGWTRITDLGECRAAMPFIEGGDPNGFMGTETDGDFPAGCYSCSKSRCGEAGSGVWFNHATKDLSKHGARPICQKGFAVEKGKTVFVGDSDIDYWVSSSKAVPGSYNVGIGGATCNDVIKEIDFILQRFEPKSVVLVCGENDLGGGASVATTFNRWTKVVNKILDASVPIVQLGTKPEADSKNLWKKYQRYDAKIKKVVADRAADALKPSLVFIDTYEAFLALGNGNNYYDPDEKPDYLHLGPEGYALWDKWVKNGLSNFGCVLWNGDICERSTFKVSGGSTCPEGFKPLESEDECRAAVGSVKLGSHNVFNGNENNAKWPAGCYYCKDVDGCADGTWFNRDKDGESVDRTQVYCKPTE